MSDTPRTDAFEALLNRPTNWWDFARELERENAELRDLAARMATEMREVDHEFASLRDYDAARKETQPIRADHSGDITEMMQVGKEAQP